MQTQKICPKKGCTKEIKKISKLCPKHASEKNSIRARIAVAERCKSPNKQRLEMLREQYEGFLDS